MSAALTEESHHPFAVLVFLPLPCRTWRVRMRPLRVWHVGGAFVHAAASPPLLGRTPRHSRVLHAALTIQLQEEEYIS